MTATTSIIPHPCRATERGTVVGSVRFTAGSSPAITSTGANGRLGASVSRSTAGKYTITLRGSWSRVSAVANLKGDDFDFAKVVSVTEGTNACTIRVNTVIDSTGYSVDDPSDVECEVLIIASSGSRGTLS